MVCLSSGSLGAPCTALVPRAGRELRPHRRRDSQDTCRLLLPRFPKGQVCRPRFSAQGPRGSVFHRVFAESPAWGSAAIAPLVEHRLPEVPAVSCWPPCYLTTKCE